MLYHTEEVVTLGGREYYRVSGHDLRAMKELHYDLNPIDPKATKTVLNSTLQLPPVNNTLKSPVVPRLLLRAEKFGELQKRNSCPVNDGYYMILCWLRKKEFFRRESRDHVNRKDIQSLDSKIRAKILDMVFNGQYVPEPTHSGLQNLNQQVEIFDLGRYKGLNMSDPQERFCEMRYNFTQKPGKQAKTERKLEREELFQRIENDKPIPSVTETPPEAETPFQRARREALERGDTSYGTA